MCFTANGGGGGGFFFFWGEQGLGGGGGGGGGRVYFIWPELVVAAREAAKSSQNGPESQTDVVLVACWSWPAGGVAGEVSGWRAGGRALCQAGRHCVCVRARGGQANERPACNTAAPDKSPALRWLRRQQQQRPQRPLGAKPAQRQREARTELGAETRASEIVRWAELAFCSRAPK